MDTLRTAWRHDDIHGYVFFNNYQRKRKMAAHKGVKLTGLLSRSESGHFDSTNFAEITIDSGEYGFFPYHMNIQDKELISATAIPLCRLEGASETDSAKQLQTYVFYGDWQPHFNWKNGLAADVIHLSRQDALNAWKVTLDRDYLLISEQYAWVEDGRLMVTGGRDTIFKSYPGLPETFCMPAQTGILPSFEKTGIDGIFTCYRRQLSGKASTAQFEKIAETARNSVYEITLEYGEAITDCLLSLQYAGDSLRIYAEDEEIEDHFYTGQEVEISLRYFNFPRRLTVQVEALQENAPVFLEQWPEMTDGKACALNKITVRDEIRS
jgi:hypothetical protein